MTRASAVLMVFFAAALPGCSIEPKEEEAYDIAIEGGLVFDGTGAPGVLTNVGIIGSEIVYVGAASSLDAKRTINAEGMIVAPGFIDPHTHAFEERPKEGPDYLESYTTQGVTSVLSGNDGGGPVDTERAYEELKARGLGANFGLFVGHGAIRRAVIGMEDRQATPQELEQMKTLVASAMKAGALGLSSGLFYAPGSFAETAEVVELARVAAEYGGIYESHIRDESNYSIGLIAAIEEVIEIGQEANIPVHIAHIKALGVDVWGQSEEIIQRIEAAQANGILVTADQYPWLASGTRVSNALIPRPAMAGGRDALYSRLRNPALLPDLQAAMAENLRRRGGPACILLTSGPEVWRGLTLEEYAEKKATSPIDAAVEIVLAGDAKIASFNMNEDDVQAFMRQPWVMSSSDGGDGHPRKYASFPQKYRQYVVEEKVLTLDEFIHKSSGLTAKTFGIDGRGEIKPQMKADIVIFDPDLYGPIATYESPAEYSDGVDYLLVNGQFAIDDGKLEKIDVGKIIAESSN